METSRASPREVFDFLREFVRDIRQGPLDQHIHIRSVDIERAPGPGGQHSKYLRQDSRRFCHVDAWLRVQVEVAPVLGHDQHLGKRHPQCLASRRVGAHRTLNLIVCHVIHPYDVST